MKQYFVYILASKRNGTLYIGVTNNLNKRVWQHKSGLVDGFTKKYSVGMLVYYERFGNIDSAIVREKRLKKWNRKWKLELIEKFNPEWKDLFEERDW
ncbi:MAG: GIY-YIG nuclease family protein [Planctomycetota bacterium]|nr:MAG: GIY-YIG nuclease family protein [Planctomycetota bacterium]